MKFGKNYGSIYDDKTNIFNDVSYHCSQVKPDNSTI